MKKTIGVILIFSLGLTGLKAQNNSKDSLAHNVISFFPLGLLTKARAQYEAVVDDNKSVGFTFSYYAALSQYRGIKFEPFFRIYFAKTAPQGAYAQLNAAVGQVHQVDNFNGNFIGDPINSTGVGVNIGYQWLLGGNHNFAINLSTGLQYYSNKKLSDFSTWFISGPGALLTPKFSIGCAF